MINKPAFGSDIEVIVKTLTGEPFPVCGLIGGSKDKPRSLGGGYAVQEDNVLLEFNIPVAATSKQFINNVITGVNKAIKELPPSLVASEESTAIYHEHYIRHIPQASVFGCDPDYNAWTQEQNPKPTAKNPYLRSAAGHIHISWDNPEPEDQLALIKWADVFVSLPSVMESNDRQRRELYGKAGAFRPKDYGIEHRVLDNYWIWTPERVQAVYKRYNYAIAAVNKQMKFDEGDEEKIQNAINKYQSAVAQALYRKYTERVCS